MRPLVIAASGLVLLASMGQAARAQGFGRGAAAGYGVSPPMPYSGGSATYLPYGTNGGGFIPYTPGPGGGLGVQSRMADRTPSNVAGMGGGMGTMPGVGGPTLGRPRAYLTPLTPIVRAGTGMGAGPMIQRSSSPGGMNRMARPPVGGYPFRQPPSLIGPAQAGPAMSM